MTEQKPQPDEDEQPKKFRIARKRLGTIRFVDPKGEYGFIEAEDFREDVFFHNSAWDPATGSGDQAANQPSFGAGNQGGAGRANAHTQNISKKLDAEELVRKHVEFELDDDLFETEQRLRAKVVRPTRRPMGRKLSGRDATFKVVTHHPKARRKRPDWRN